jgi:hypothetical protein
MLPPQLISAGICPGHDRVRGPPRALASTGLPHRESRLAHVGAGDGLLAGGNDHGGVVVEITAAPFDQPVGVSDQCVARTENGGALAVPVAADDRCRGLPASGWRAAAESWQSGGWQCSTSRHVPPPDPQRTASSSPTGPFRPNRLARRFGRSPNRIARGAACSAPDVASLPGDPASPLWLRASRRASSMSPT